MPTIKRHSRRLRQPQAPVGLNRGHPLAAQIRLALTGANTRDAKRGVVIAKGASAGFQAYPPGQWMQKFSGSATAGTQLAAGSGLSYLLPVTIPIVGGLNPFWGVVQVWIQSLGTRRVILADFSAAGSNASIRLEQQAANTWIFGVSDGGAFHDASGGAVTIGLHTLAFWQDAGDRKTRLIVDGGPTLVSSTAPTVRAAGTDLRLGSAGAFTTLPFDGGASALVIGEGNPSEYQMRDLCARPWAVFDGPKKRKQYVSGGASHAATGVLAADAATVSGAAAHLTLHAASGALSAGDATVAGAAAHLVLHASSGALVADAATVAGSAAHLTLHASSGALVAGDAAVSGSATLTVPGGSHAATGGLVADAATVAGSAAHLTLHTASGTLGSGDAAVSGSAAHLATHDATGALVAGDAAISGVAVNGVVDEFTSHYGNQLMQVPEVADEDHEIMDIITALAAVGAFE